MISFHAVNISTASIYWMCDCNNKALPWLTERPTIAAGAYR